MSSRRPVPHVQSALHTQITKCQPEQETVATARIARRLVIAPPRQAERETIVIIGDAKAMAD